MIPKYFRCVDPSHKCPLSVSKDLIKEDKKWTCPCANANCTDFQKPVSFAEGITGGRSWLFYGGLGAVALIFLMLFFMGGSDPCVEQLKELQSRLVPLEKELATLESKPTAKGDSLSSGVTAAAGVKSSAAELEKKSNQALAAGDESQIAKLLVEVGQGINSATLVIQSQDKPDFGSGVQVAAAKSLIGRLMPLEGEVEEQLEVAQSKCPKHVGQFEDLKSSIEASVTKARHFASPAGAQSSSDDGLRKSISASIATLKALESKLKSHVPPPQPKEGPFPIEAADLRIAASPDLTARLVGPLAAAWSDSKIIEGPNGVLFVDSASRGKLVIEPCKSDQGFQRLAAGEVALYFADRAPTSNELEKFGPGFKESRSVAEVVALDALTLLVHPDNKTDTFEVARPVSFRLAAGPQGSDVRERAALCDFRSSESLEVFGEQAALLDRETLALGLYHNEGQNLRAKRLAVKASPEALALKPSPFTIATEDYLYSYRIVAWTPPRPPEKALAFVKFVTSNPGQEIVEKSGYVDLRLRPVPGQVDPRILAALGEALGTNTVSSAIRLSTNFRFDVGLAALDLKAQADLERLPRDVAQNYPSYQVVILGFTDSDGGPAINAPLSVKRATAVAEELRRSKVDTRAGGLGDSFPIDTNKTDAGKARNRRAEVWVAKP